MIKRIISCILIFILIGSTTYASSAKYRIEVNTSKCRVIVYQQTNIGWMKLGQQKCCLGAKGKTPKGLFTIYKKKNYFVHNDARYDYVSYFDNNKAFHSTPYINGKYDNSSLGHHRSGGCIRLKPSAAKWIYKYCKTGTEVLIK